jgi:hypothetical protein
MSGVQIPVEAKLNDGDLDAELSKLTEKINRVGQSIAQANKVKFNPVSRATLDDLKRITAQFEAMKKASPNFAREISGSGQGRKSFLDLDWNMMVGNAVAREARRFAAFNKIVGFTGAGFTAPGGVSYVGGGVSFPAAPNYGPGGNPWWNAGRQVVGAGLKSIGPVGNVANNALSAGLTGGITAGLAGLAGGLVAIGISKAIGAVGAKVGAAQNDMIGYDTLKRMLGDVNVGFDTLRRSLHASSDAIDVNYQEVQKLGKEFTHISGISGDAAKSLAEEVRVGGGFGRSFGVDPSQSNAFFAQMRQFRITSNESDSRKLALYIGEAIAKSGAFAKADEMLQAISSYASQQTRLGLTAANVGDYSGLLAGFVGSKTPGLDPAGAAQLLSRVNGAFLSGGSAGEAGQNFMYMAIGRQLGLDPIQSALLREQGAFGTGAGTFGKGSLYSQFASKFHLNTPGTAANSRETNLQFVMRRMQSVYGGNPELMLSAMSNLFGIGTNQAMALATIGPDKLGGLQQALSSSGVDLTKMSATGISALAQIVGGNRDVLNAQASALRPRLTADEARGLDAAQGGGDIEKLRSTLVQLTAKYGQEETEGQQTRKSIQDLDKDLMDAASKMIGPLNTMRDTLLYAFGNRGSMTAEDMHNAVVEAQRKHVNDEADARISKARGQLSAVSAVDDFGRPIYPKEQQQAYENLQSETAAANKVRANKLAAIAGPGLLRDLAETDRIVGLTPGTSAAQIMQESSFDPNARSTRGAMGLAQVMPSTLKALEKRLGRTLDPDDPRDAVLIQRELMRENMAKFGNQADALRAYNSGWDKSKWNNSETNDYVSKIGGYTPYFAGTPLPDGGQAASAGDPHKQWFAFEHNITLQYPNGQPAAPAATVTKQVNAPMAFGVM